VIARSAAGKSFIRTYFVLASSGHRKMKETVATLGFMLFFAGAMLDISGSLFVTQGGVSPSTYFMVGLIELVGTIVFLAGIFLIVRTR
jgi:formate/nitrite transporter FocA (FNT family)